MAKQSSLDRLLEAQGCSGLDDLVPKFCVGCPYEKSCEVGKMRCRAVNVILAMASKFSAQSEVGKASISSYFENLKSAVNP